MNVQKIYEYALQREQEGYQFFTVNADKATHAAAAEVFRKLAEEELKHIEFIKRNMSASGEGPTEAPPFTEDDWFEKRARKELLDQSLLESMIPDVAVLRTAFLIERDLSEFYEMAAANATGRAQQVFATLARWERGHESLFRELHDRVFEQYTQMPWGG